MIKPDTLPELHLLPLLTVFRLVLQMSSRGCPAQQSRVVLDMATIPYERELCEVFAAFTS
jgi:hypothetical protein